MKVSKVLVRDLNECPYYRGFLYTDVVIREVPLYYVMEEAIMSTRRSGHHQGKLRSVRLMQAILGLGLFMIPMEWQFIIDVDGGLLDRRGPSGSGRFLFQLIVHTGHTCFDFINFQRLLFANEHGIAKFMKYNPRKKLAIYTEQELGSYHPFSHFWLH